MIAGGKVKGRKDTKKHKSSLSNKEKQSSTANDALRKASKRKAIIKENGDSRKKRGRGASRPGRIL